MNTKEALTSAVTKTILVFDLATQKGNQSRFNSKAIGGTLNQDLKKLRQKLQAERRKREAEERAEKIRKEMEKWN